MLHPHCMVKTMAKLVYPSSGHAGYFLQHHLAWFPERRPALARRTVHRGVASLFLSARLKVAGDQPAMGIRRSLPRPSPVLVALEGESHSCRNGIPATRAIPDRASQTCSQRSCGFLRRHMGTDVLLGAPMARDELGRRNDNAVHAAQVDFRQRVPRACKRFGRARGRPDAPELLVEDLRDSVFLAEQVSAAPALVETSSASSRVGGRIL
jgi:hypothetical protein